MAAAKRHHTKTVQRVAAREEEKHRAWKLTVAGMTVRDIARILGCSHGKAHTLVREARAEAIERMKEERKAWLVEVAHRQRMISRTHFRRRKVKDSAQLVQASDKILIDLLDDKATRVELSGPDGGPVKLDVDPSDEILGKLARLAADAGAGTPGSEPQSG